MENRTGQIGKSWKPSQTKHKESSSRQALTDLLFILLHLFTSCIGKFDPHHWIPFSPLKWSILTYCAPTLSPALQGVFNKRQERSPLQSVSSMCSISILWMWTVSSEPTTHLCSSSKTLPLGTVHWKCTPPSGNDASATSLPCWLFWKCDTENPVGCIEGRDHETTDKCVHFWPKMMLLATTLPPWMQLVCRVGTRWSSSLWNCSTKRHPRCVPMVTVCHQCTISWACISILVYREAALWKIDNMEGASNLYRQQSRSSREQDIEWRLRAAESRTHSGDAVLFFRVYVTVKTISDLNKVAKICFGTQLQRVQPLVFGFTDPGLWMVQIIMVAGACGRDYCHLRSTASRDRGMGRLRKAPPKTHSAWLPARLWLLRFPKAPKIIGAGD